MLHSLGHNTAGSALELSVAYLLIIFSGCRKLSQRSKIQINLVFFFRVLCLDYEMRMSSLRGGKGRREAKRGLDFRGVNSCLIWMNVIFVAFQFHNRGSAMEVSKWTVKVEACFLHLNFLGPITPSILWYFALRSSLNISFSYNKYFNE